MSERYTSERYTSERPAYEETILFGVHALSTVITHAPERLLRVLYSGARSGARGEVLEAAEAAGCPVEQARDRQLDHLLPDEQHQGLLAFVRPAPLAEWHDLCALSQRSLEEGRPAPLLVALDQVTDARNFGAIIRSAEALGASGAVITSNRCARPGPIAARTSAGASELLPIAMVTNLSQALLEAKEAGFQVIGADMDGSPAYALDWAAPTVLVIGAEGKGLRDKTRATCDAVASIPLRGHTESLNASVAAGVLLYEASKARQQLGAAQRRD
jgi:23S rRNA (guanosine2251-2'-O)-methyltransferase